MLATWAGTWSVARITRIRTAPGFWRAPRPQRGRTRAARSTLETDTYFWNADQDRVDRIVYPDGRWDEYDYDDAVGFTPSGSLPGTPPTYDVGGSGYHYRETVHGFNDSGSLGTVTGASTREVVISDAGGLPVFQETWAYTAGGQVRVGWTAWTYDDQFRPTGVYKSNGAYKTTSYTSCCTTTVVDETGVETVAEKDVLGRPTTVTRSAISSYNDGSFTYPAQAAIATTYDYSTPLQVEVTRSASSLSDTATYVYDAAKRLASVTTGSGSGALKTLYAYGSTANGGDQVTAVQRLPHHREQRNGWGARPDHGQIPRRLAQERDRFHGGWRRTTTTAPAPVKAGL